MAIDFNTEPYYDDFNESKRFLRILYRPGFAVQARELTQMQTILQNQISRFGDHVFKEGSMVIPGNSGVDTKIGYVKLTSTSGAIQNLVGLIVTNSAGVKAQVIHSTTASGADPAALYISYINSGDNTTTKTFSNSDNLLKLDPCVNFDPPISSSKSACASRWTTVTFLNLLIAPLPAGKLIE